MTARKRALRPRPLSDAAAVTPLDAAARPSGLGAWRVELAVFAVALAVRLVYLWTLSRTPLGDVLAGDALRYDAWAKAVAAGDWMSRAEGVFYQAPLYPYLLAVVYALAGHSLSAVRLVQAVLGAAAAALLARAGSRLYGRTVGAIAGGALALWAPAVFYDGLLQKSVLDGFFLTLLLAVLAGTVEGSPPAHGRSRWLAAGVALGGLVLARENALVIAVLLLGWQLWRGRSEPWPRRLVPPAALLAGMAVLLLPVAARNAAVGGELHLTTSQLGINLYLGNNPKANGTYVPLRGARGSPVYEREDATLLAEQAEGRKLSAGEISDYWLRQSLAWITAEPAAFARLALRKTALFVNDVEVCDTDDFYGYADVSPVLAVLRWPFRFGLLLPLAALGAALTWRTRPATRLLVVTATVYAASVIAFLVYGRYRFPVVHLLLPVAAAGIVEARERWRAGERRSLLPSGAGALAAAVVAFLPLVDVTAQRALTPSSIGYELLYRRNDPAGAQVWFERALGLSPAFGHAELGLADALLHLHRPADALPHYQRATTLEPELEPAFYNLGQALVELKRPEEAVAAYRRAIAINPQRAGTYTLLGNALFALGRLPEAEAAYRDAIARDPANAVAHSNLGTVRARAGDLPGALEEFRAAVAADPAYAEGHYNLGKALQALGRSGEAEAEFAKTLELAPGHADARRRLEQLRSPAR